MNLGDEPDMIFERLRRWFRKSPHIHVRTHEVNTLEGVIDLFDRFVDGKVAYPLEWDDFISWKNGNPNIEAIRDRIGKFESLLFSKDVSDRERYANLIVDERNRIAGFVGTPTRNYVHLSDVS